MFYRYTYFPAPRIAFQGTRAELLRKLRSSGLHVVSGSNGSYVLEGYSSGIIYEFTDIVSSVPIRQVTPDKNMMRFRYGKKEITDSDYLKLTNELNNGSIHFDSLLTQK
jgi:hypothetical protein